MTTKVTNIYNLKLTPSQFGQSSLVVNCSQYDSLFRVIQFNLFNGNSIYSIPEGSVVTIRGTKKDNTGFEYECDYYNNVVTFPIRNQITIYPGKVPAELRIVNDGEIIGSWNFLFLVEESPLTNDTIISETQLPLLESALQAASEAENYKNLAQASADNASESEQNASESEANALTYSQNAQTSANSASQSEANALTYSQNASESASEAQGYAQDSEDSATQAQGYATSASQSATTAQQIADNIADLVDEAQGYASQSSQSASQAQGYATQASQSATNASQSASNAQTYASNANTSAQNASSSATSAQTYAGNASTSATQSALSATASAQSATNAQTYANNASTSATQAQGYATNASDSATASASSATESQGYAQNASDSASEAQELVDTVEERIANKADIDGVYPKLVAGDLVESETKDDVFTYQVTDHTGKANINSIKGNTIVWNQLENATVSRTHVGITYTCENGKLRVNGTATGTSYWLAAADGTLISLVQGHKYLVSLGNGSYTGSGATYGWYFTVSYKNFFQNSEIYTAPASQDVKLNFTVVSGQTIDMEFTPQVFDLTQMFGAGNEPSSVADFTKLYLLPYYQYESGKLLPFTGTGIKTTNADNTIEETLSLPIAQYFPTGMKSVGSVYDELTPTKAITRIGAVDIGTLTWNYDTTNAFFYADLSQVKRPSNWGEIINAVCVLYQSVSGNTLTTSGSDMCLSGNPSRSQIRIKNSSYTDATAFKNAMSGQILFFELATYEETNVDLDLSYNTYEGGTEQLLPVNTDVPVTSPISMNVEFDFGENLNARLNKMLSCLAQVETSPSTHNYSVGQYLMYEYQLYKVTSAITTGQSLTVGTNIVATTVMSELLSLTA